MSLRIKLALSMTAIVLTALIATGLLARRVFQPFARAVTSGYLDEIAYIAAQIDEGAKPEDLGRALNLEVELHTRPPGWAKPGFRARMRCVHEDRGPYSITHCRGPRAPATVETKHGFVVVKRDLDVAAPEDRLTELWIFIAAVVTLFSIFAATLITKPLTTTKHAMERVAKGDLAHRLPVGGGRELAEVARAFNAMTDRVDTLLRTERELMAGISHELRTPLARLRLQLELLRDLGAAPEKRLGAMEADLEEVNALIGELLECSRLSLGERTLERAPVSLERVVREAMEKNPLPHHAVSVEVSEPRDIEGDHARLVRAVGNLIQNAGKYAPESTEVIIAIKGTEIAVLDRGPGVAGEELGRLFEPFYRGTNARSQSKGGLGLGLMIARQVATLHGGEIEAKNREGGGLAITIRLPAG